jgi:hypothetical protein
VYKILYICYLLFLTVIHTVLSFIHSSITIRHSSSCILIAFPISKRRTSKRGRAGNRKFCNVQCNTPILCLLPQDKFRLDLSEEEAVQYMQNLIDVSATAIMAAMVERLHSLAQYWRK